MTRRTYSSLTCMTFLSACLLLMAIHGCASTPTTDANKDANRDTPAVHQPTPRPAQLRVSIYSIAKDSRYTYLEINRKGELLYNGGRQATQRTGKPVTTLDDAQLDAVWDVICRYNLTEAPNTTFAKAERVSYEVTINTGGVTHSFRTIDDRVPGVKQLNDLLFDYQADVRYKVPGVGGQ